MRVEHVELWRIQIPFKRAFGHAAHQRRSTDAVIVGIRDETGTTGWGEILPRRYVTGETVEEVLDHTAPRLANALLGRAFEDRDTLVRWIEQAAHDLGRKLATLCGFDLALVDLAGQRFGFSAADLLADRSAGLAGEALAPGVVIGFEIATEKLARYCATLRLSGRRHIKIKVGRDDDHERLLAVAGVFGNTPLRLDANAAWSAQQTIERLQRFRDIPIASIEQPVPADDLAGLRRIRQETGIAVMADESVCTLDDAARLAGEGAADIFNVRLGKNGGLLASRRLVELARQADVEVHLGTMVGETGVLSRASEVFGRCVAGFDCLDGKGQNAFLLAQDILERDDPTREAEHDPPGLGVRVSTSALLAHQVGETRGMSRPTRG